ncbi:hypothetical protein, partial [Salmonella sp. SAL4438]|uniref:hypothetical protein n=1 Tax=Salmonella sp. SAL4438 TaxID=3159893 RepID=UPI00397900DF
GESSSQFIPSQALDGTPHYVLSRVEQRTVSLTTRVNFTFSPTLSFEFYGQPFVATGTFDRFAQVVQPRAHCGEQRLALQPVLNAEQGIYT